MIKKSYELYQSDKISLRDLIDYFNESGIDISMPSKRFASGRTNMDRSHFSRLLVSPLYVRADAEVYRYLSSKGYEMLDDVSAFDGVHGLFRHKNDDGSEYIKVGYHEGLIDADVWLAVHDKKSHNKKIPNNGTSKNSWLVGLVKCGHCGYAFNIVYGWNKAHTIKWRYYIDSGAYRANGCVKKRLATKTDEVEKAVYEAMKERIEQLEIAKRESNKPNIELENLKADVLRIDDEIRKLMDKLANADDILFDYINRRVKELHNKKSEIEEKIRMQSRKHKTINSKPLETPLSRWDKLSVDEKHQLASTMIDVVYVSDEKGIDIRFSI